MGSLSFALTMNFGRSSFEPGWLCILVMISYRGNAIRVYTVLPEICTGGLFEDHCPGGSEGPSSVVRSTWPQP